MEIVKIKDAKLAIQINGRGENIFLVSGLGGRASFWNNTKPSLEKKFTVIYLFNKASHTHAEKKTQTKKLLHNLQKPTQQRLLVFLCSVENMQYMWNEPVL